MTGRWLSTKEVADRLGTGTIRTIYRLINRGDLDAYRFGRVIRVRSDDLDAFLDHGHWPDDGWDDPPPAPVPVT